MSPRSTFAPLHYWRRLLMGGAAVGSLMGLAEVCWAFLLPTVFPKRRYTLPADEIVEFTLIAVATDVLILLAAAVVLGAVLGIVRMVWRRSGTSPWWPALARTILMTGAGCYLLVSWSRIYHFGGIASTSKSSFVATALPLVGVILVVVGYLIERARRRFGPTVTVATWGALVVALTFTGAVAAIVHWPESTWQNDWPTFDTHDTPQVLLVTLDTCRADHLGCYGSEIVQTPTLDALAEDSVLFEQAFAQASSTTPSHCSLMTSTYAARHGAVNGISMRDDLPTIAEVFRENGCETSAFVSSTIVRSSNSGLQRGISYYEDSISPWSAFFRRDALQFIAAFCILAWTEGNQIPADIVTDRAIAWFDDRHPDEPFFCWVHYYDPHRPYAPPRPYTDMYAGLLDTTEPRSSSPDRYAAEITFMDAQFGRLLDALRRKGLYDRALLIVTADHGEAFGERHGEVIEFGHGKYLYESTQHVPLIVKLPGQSGARRRVPELVQLVDIAPTILEFFGAPFPATFQGKSFIDLLRGAKRSEPGVAFAERASLMPIGQVADLRAMGHLMCLRTPKIKYICDDDRRHEELYDLHSDPAETTNLLQGKAALADSCYAVLSDTLGESVQSRRQPQEIDPRVLRGLKALGYVDYDGDQESEEED